MNEVLSRFSTITERKIRTRNKGYYRVNHWPIWITVFFLSPGPLTFDLFEKGFDWRMAAWLGLVLLVTGYFGLRGQLPGAKPHRTSSVSPKTNRIRSIGGFVTPSRGRQ